MADIEGTVENIIFKNDENGYVVAELDSEDDLVTIVGCIPYIMEGQNLKLQGQWVVHPQFGKQFKAEVCEEILPDSAAGIEKYLSSGVIAGIGPVTAKKIVEKFGDKTFEILDSDMSRLSEIEGIGDKKIALIYDSYVKQREVRGIMVFLQTYGVTPSQCTKIYKKFGTDSIKIIKENPYSITEEISGIGFKTADKIARNLGVKPDSPYRIKSGIKFIVNEFCMQGNTYMPMDKLIKQGREVLCVSIEDIENAITEEALEGKIKVDKINEVQCVFTMPYYYCELGVTKKILTLTLAKYEDVKIDVDKEISNFEKDNNIIFAESQKEAIKGAVQNGIEIITGGPGTGKTTIINCITQIFETAGMRVFMAAPTGRAAKRMSEATGREAKTIHRLLEMGYSEDDELDFFKSEESPLECDALIVDEASMIDIMLMNNMLKAVTVGTRVIIVGDADQLPSVGPGNVLRDIIESNCVKVVRLKEIFRQAQESMIIVNAHRINSGEMPFLNEKDKDFYFIKCENNDEILNTVIQLVNSRLPKFNTSWNSIQHMQVLTPMRKGVLGTYNLNRNLQNVLNPAQNHKQEKELSNAIFREGDKVMQIKNNYVIKWERINGEGEKEGIGVFNGDVGYIESIDQEENTISVVFDEERRVIYEPSYFDELELAYAVTIHKSQGSEFPVIVMPVFMGPPLLMNRNLFYTGITRAKELVVIVGYLKAVKYMVDNNKSFERYSALKWRITDILSSSDIV